MNLKIVSKNSLGLVDNKRLDEGSAIISELLSLVWQDKINALIWC